MNKGKAKDPEVIPPAEEPVKRDALATSRRDLPTEINVNLVKEKFVQIQAFQVLVQKNLHEGIDFGVIPGTKKPTLLKPGAEKIAKLLDLADTFEFVDKTEDYEKGFFAYTVRIRLVSLISGQVVSEGVGSCNSKELKYRWNWVTRDEIPAGVNVDTLPSRGTKRAIFEFEFAIRNRESGGKYGKPAAYWDMWDAAIKARRAKPMEKETRDKSKMLKGYELVIDETRYRVPNEDPFSIVNTIVKMAKKRAMVDACLSVGRLSELFTQDLEDLQDTHNGGGTSDYPPQDEPEEKKPEEKKPEPSKPKPAPAAAKPKEEPKPKAAAAKPAPGTDFPEDEDDDGGSPPDETPEPELKDKPTNPLAETVKALQEHLKIAFGKHYEKDYREFKAWLGDLAGPKMGRNFVGLDHGNWSLNAGDIADLLFLWQNRNQCLEGFAKYRAKQAAAVEGK